MSNVDISARKSRVLMVAVNSSEFQNDEAHIIVTIVTFIGVPRITDCEEYIGGRRTQKLNHMYKYRRTYFSISWTESKSYRIRCYLEAFLYNVHTIRKTECSGEV